MKHAPLAFLALALPASTLAFVTPVAAPGAPAQEKPAAAAASAITLDPVHSMGIFRVHHLEAGYFYGRFKELEGTATWALDDSVAPTFDVTAKVKNADTGSAKLDGNLQGPNFFNEAEFPTMRFVSKSAKRLGERHYAVTGDFTLRGVTREVEIDCTVTGVGKGPLGPKVGFECLLTIKRSDYGMDWGIAKPPKALGDEVRLIVSLEGDVKKG